MEEADGGSGTRSDVRTRRRRSYRERLEMVVAAPWLRSSRKGDGEARVHEMVWGGVLVLR